MNRYLDYSEREHEEPRQSSAGGRSWNDAGAGGDLEDTVQTGFYSGRPARCGFGKLIDPFGGVKQETDLFEAGRAGVNLLLATWSRRGRLAAGAYGGVAGGQTENCMPVSSGIFLQVFDAQRLIPLDDLFLAADKIGKGTADPKALKGLTDQLKRLSEIEPIRGSLSAEEKNSMALGYWSERHVDQERKLNIDALLKGPRRMTRAWLAPFLRDSLVGLCLLLTMRRRVRSCY